MELEKVWKFCASCGRPISGNKIICIDVDGNSYKTIKIGNQIWMAENLKVTRYQNGDPIPTGHTNSEWSDLEDTETGAFSVSKDDPANADTYGNLYNWFAVNDDRGICPNGWHAPTDEEWMELEMYLGMSFEEAHKLDMRGTNEGSKLAGNEELWSNGGLKNNREFGVSDFLVLPGGYHNYDGVSYPYNCLDGSFWSSSAINRNYAWCRLLSYSDSEVYRNGFDVRSGFSVRCIRDIS